MAQESTPRQRITAAAAREGDAVFVARCVAILEQGAVDAQLFDVLGGTSAGPVLAGRYGGPQGYWARTWALRALLYAWDDAAEPALVAACSDPHWRVREMSAKVLARRQLSHPHAEQALERLDEDEHPRVRAAARRALGGCT